jgi:alpha-tubulin suppressor-like RCC1 family protein
MNTNYLDNNQDLGDKYITKDYLLDVYPNLILNLFNSLLFTSGSNTNGQLGDNTATHKSSPIQTIASGNTWKQISLGYTHAAGIKTDGTLWLWGANNMGQLGTNNTTTQSSPVQTITTGTNWRYVACGYRYTCATKTDGSLWLWGDNAYGKLGTNNITGRSSPVQTVTTGTNWKQVSCGTYHTAAVKFDGTLWTWGYNGTGQLGDNTLVSKSSPVQTVATGTNWKQVACGYNHIAAIKTDGSLWTCGYGYRGQLGNNINWNYSSPIQTVTTGNNWKQVSAYEHTTTAIKTDGTLWLWGNNDTGQLGDNTTTTRSSPVQTIMAGNNWKQVACGYHHTAFLRNDGTVWLSGKNNFGQLGDNTITNKSSPVQTIATGNNWKQVACGTDKTGFIEGS